MSFDYFEEDSHIKTYSKFRPDPPKSLIERIIKYTSEEVSKYSVLGKEISNAQFKIVLTCYTDKNEKFLEPLELAVDVGCGSGQSTEVLADYFKSVIGLDFNLGIIQEARKKCRHLNVFYKTSPGEQMDVENETANLVSACQAIHWFDIPKFYSEVDRVLKPKGVLAVYGYNLPVPVYRDNKEIEKIIEKYYKDVLNLYIWPQSRKVYLESYTAKEFNEVYFVEGGKMQREENFLLEVEGNINDIVGYITSWSGFQNYKKQRGEENSQKLLKTFKKDFKDALQVDGDIEETMKIRFNYFLLLGRKT